MTLKVTGRFRQGWLARLWAFQLPVQSSPQPLARRDAGVMVALVVVAGLAYALAVATWGDATLRLSIAGRWFQSDGWRVFDDLTRFGANHFRDQVHPLFSLIGLASTAVIRALTGADPVTVIRLFNGLCFVSWCTLLFATLRLARVCLIDALLLVCVAMLSAGSLFWFIVPETYVPGTVSIAACLFVVALGRSRDWAFVAAAAGSLSFTVTNWIAGLAAIASSRRLGRGAILAGLSLGLVLAGWGVGKVIFPHPASLFLLPGVVQNESEFIGDKHAGGLLHKAAGVLVSPMVVPAPVGIAPQPTGPLLSVQRAAISDWGRGQLLFVAAGLVWLALLAVSLPLVALRRDRLAIALLLTLAGQTALHLIYGDETFLYALHFVPLHVLALGVGPAARYPRLFRPACLVLVVLMAANNISHLNQAARSPLAGHDPRLERLSAGWQAVP